MMLTRRSAGVVSIAALLLIFSGCHGFFGTRDDSGGGNGGGGTGVTPKFAYVANAATTLSDSTISAFTVNASSGVLTPSGTPADMTYAEASSATTDPSGNRVFVMLGSLGILTYQIDRTSGAIYTPENIYQAANAAPSAAVVSPDGTLLFTISDTNNAISVFQVGSSGLLTQNGVSLALGSGAVSPLGITLDPTGRLLYVADDAAGTFIYTVSSGVLTLTNQLAPNGNLASRGVAIAPNGKYAYIANGGTTGGVDMYAVNSSNGSLTLMNGSPVATGGIGPGPIAVDPTGTYLYVANVGSANVAAFKIGSDGTLTTASGSPFTVGHNPVSVAADPSGLFLYVANKDDGTVSIFKIGSGGTLSTVGYVNSASPNSVVVTK